MIGSDLALPHEVARSQIDLFEEQFAELYGEESGEAMLAYACHAALPLTLTTELAYLIRQRVSEEYGIKLPWTAAPELLLSILCDTIGSDLYAMSVEIRGELLKQLLEEYQAARIEDLGLWLADYVYYRMQIDKKLRGRILGEPIVWIALVCFSEKYETTAQIKQYLSELHQISQKNGGLQKLIRWSLVDNTMPGLLSQIGFQQVEWNELAQELHKETSDRAITAQPDTTTASSADLLSNTVEAGDALFEFEFDVGRVDSTGKIITPAERGQAWAFREPLGDVDLVMVAIAGDSFMMGSPDGEIDRFPDESPQHEVTVPSFFMGKYPVTQAQWQAIMGNNPSSFQQDGNDLPVEKVSWLDAVAFCERISTRTARSYRLPSEAEWEYACRAGTKTPFYFGETITTDIANYNGTDDTDGKWSGSYAGGAKGIYRTTTTSVGMFLPNKFGLYDMHGNVWEWCLDHWHSDYDGAPIDGTAWLSKDKEKPRYVVRGGSWDLNPLYCRSATRNYDDPDNSLNYIGFRVMCEMPRTS